MKKTRNDLVIFAFSALCIAGSFVLAYLPRNPVGIAGSGLSGIAVLEDPSSVLIPADLPGLAGEFRNLSRPLFYGKHSASSFWLRFTAEGSGIPGRERFLEINNANLEEIDIDFPGHPTVHAGRKVPSDRIELMTRIWNIPLPADLPAGEPVYVRVRSSTILWVPLRIVDGRELTRTAFRDNLFFGCFFGILVAVIIVNLFSFLVLKARFFLIYILYLVSLLAYHLRIHGYLYLIAPMPFPLLEATAWISLSGFGISLIVFARQFLDLPRNNRAVCRLLDIMIGFFVLQGILGSAGRPDLGNRIGYVTGFIVPFVIISATIREYFRGKRHVRFYLIAWGALFSGTVIWTTAAYLEAQIPANYFFIIGTTVDSLLFTLAIFDRIRDELHEKDLLQAREQYYKEQARTDTLTGLYNRRFLEEETRSFNGRSHFSGMSMIMIDLDDFKTVNDTYGHQTGDMLLKRMGGTIRKHIRRSDIACRYGGDEFLILLEGAGLETARSIAEGIRSEILGNTYVCETGIPVSCTVSIGLSECRTEDSFEGLFLRADAALFQAKNLGRNRISVL